MSAAGWTKGAFRTEWHVDACAMVVSVEIPRDRLVMLRDSSLLAEEIAAYLAEEVRTAYLAAWAAPGKETLPITGALVPHASAEALVTLVPVARRLGAGG